MTSPPLFRCRHRRTSDVTAARLGRAVLAYLAVIMGIITLAPFQFSATPMHGLTSIWDWKDIIMNIVMFLPFGFVYQLTCPTGSPVSLLRILLLGGMLSTLVETAQLFEATRYPSLVDVSTNAIGAGLGAIIYAVILRRIEGERAVRILALELPLMALVYLLIPLSWLMGLVGAGSSRGWLALPIAIFAGSILGTVHAAYLVPYRGIARGWLLLGAFVWFAVALLPGTVGDYAMLMAAAVLTVSSAWLRSIATARWRNQQTNRRFELPTLRLVLPFFVAYLAFSSLWPLDSGVTNWRYTLALLSPSTSSTSDLIYGILEPIAAFTLVGYMVAEFYGRNFVQFRDMALRVLVWGGGISLLLETTRGWHPHYGANPLMFLLTLAACGYGGWLYLLQRDHVTALLARRTYIERPGS